MAQIIYLQLNYGWTSVHKHFQKCFFIGETNLKLKLSHKLLAAFLLSSLGIIIMLTGVTLFFSFKNFSEYLGNRILENQDRLVTKIQDEYKKNSGWETLKRDSSIWGKMLESARPFEEERPDGREMRLPGDPPPFGIKEPGHPIEDIEDDDMLPPPEHDPSFHESGNIRDELKERFPERFKKWEKTGRLPFIEERIKKNLERRGSHPLVSRLSLFDENLQPVAGKATSTHNHVLREIEINGKTVGWLGIKTNRTPSHPLDSDYMKRQSIIFLFAGICVLALSGLVSYMVSRHLIKPVKELAEATKALTSRNFETRIHVKSGDELGQLAEDFNTLAFTLKRYEELRRQWLSDISHELRTPVSILRGEIESIQDGIRSFTPETAESLHAEIMRLGRLINDLHDLSTAESGALKISKEPVKPLQILKDTLGVFSKKLMDQRMSVSDMTADTLGMEIMGDHDRLAQVFSNLLENSLRYTFSPGKLLLSADAKGRFLTINIEDSAPSVPSEAMPKLFDRLYRVDESRSRKNGGSGIGLSICKHIIEAHDGTIMAAESEAGGVKMQICLPLMNPKMN